MCGCGKNAFKKLSSGAVLPRNRGTMPTNRVRVSAQSYGRFPEFDRRGRMVSQESRG
jgi:hypothetical protein